MIINPFVFGGGGGGGGSPGAHRYWRVKIYANDGSSLYMGLSEFTLRDAGGTNLIAGAIGGMAASSIINASNDQYKAVDGNTTSSGWLSASASPGEWIRADLVAIYGSAQEVKTVDIWGSWNAPTASPKDFDIEYSDDTFSWAVAASFTGETGWAASEQRTFTVF